MHRRPVRLKYEEEINLFMVISSPCPERKLQGNVACVFKCIGNLETMEKIQVSVQNVVSVLVKYLLCH